MYYKMWVPALLSLLLLSSTCHGKRLLKDADKADKVEDVVIESVLPKPDGDHVQMITLKNIHPESIDISDWTIQSLSNPKDKFELKKNTVLQSGESLQLKRSSSVSCDTCFKFELLTSNAILLSDANSNVKNVVSWSQAKTQSIIRRLGSGEYISLPGNSDSFSDFMKGTDQLSMFYRLLHHYQFDTALNGEKRPPCRPAPRGPCFLWYCPPPPPCIEQDTVLPLTKEEGPFTVFALTNDAIKKTLDSWSSEIGEIMTLEKVLKNPSYSKRLEDIVRYHIIKDKALGTSDMTIDASTFENDSESGSKDQYKYARTIRHGDTTGNEIVFFLDPKGKITLHDNCVDVPPPGEHGCDKQLEWGKCSEAWMQDGAASGRPLGFCELSCQKCICTSDSCKSEIIIPDILVSPTKIKDVQGSYKDPSVVVHVLSNTLMPPEQYDLPKPPPPPPAPTPPPLYVWNPYTHQEDEIAEWNDATNSYQPSEKQNKSGNSLPYSWQYVWDTETGQYQYVMVSNNNSNNNNP